MITIFNLKTVYKFILFVFIIIIASILRFASIDTYPDYLSSDSAKFGFLLLKALEGENHFPFAPQNFEFDETGLVYLSVPIALCFNPRIVVLRSISAVLGLILVCCVFWFSHRLLNINIAFSSALFAATLPWLVKHDHFIHLARFNVVCISYLITIGLIYPTCSLKFPRTLLSASVAGMSLYFHGSSRLLPIIIFVLTVMNIFLEKRGNLRRIILKYGTIWFVVYSFFSLPMIYALINNPSAIAHKLIRFSFLDRNLSKEKMNAEVTELTESEDSYPLQMKTFPIKKSPPSLTTKLERIQLDTANHNKKKMLDPNFSLRKRILKSIIMICKRLFFMETANSKKLDQKEFIINPFLTIFFCVGLVGRTKFTGKRLLVVWLLFWFLAMALISSGIWSTCYYILGIIPITIFSAIGIDVLISYLKQKFPHMIIQINSMYYVVVIICLLPNWISYSNFVIETENQPVTLLKLHYDLSELKLPDIPHIFYFEEISPLKYIPPGMIYAIESMLKNVYYLDKKTATSATLVPGSRTCEYDPNKDLLFNVISRPGVFHSDIFDYNIRILDIGRLKKSDLCISLCSGDLSKYVGKRP